MEISYWREILIKYEFSSELLAGKVDYVPLVWKNIWSCIRNFFGIALYSRSQDEPKQASAKLFRSLPGVILLNAGLAIITFAANE